MRLQAFLELTVSTDTNTVPHNRRHARLMIGSEDRAFHDMVLSSLEEFTTSLNALFYLL